MNQKELAKNKITSSLLKSETAFVVATQIAIKGSAPQNLGAKAIFTQDGLHWGTIGGGKIENHCKKFAVNLLNDAPDKTCIVQEWNLQKDIGMTCGGVVTILFEMFKPEYQWVITVFGAGHVSQALCPLLATLNCKVNCIDNRPEWLEKLPKLANIKVYNVPEMQSFVKNIPDNSFAVVLTKGHATDVPILKEILTTKNLPYIGAIGSKIKRISLEKQLKELDVTQDSLKKLICPIGEPFGNNDPAEIAISIAAQLLKARDNAL